MKAKVTISRSSDDKVRICLTDAASGIEFAEVAMELEAYAQAITGLSYVEGDLEVRGLEWVGKRRITEKREVVCPLKSYDRNELSKWLRDNAQEDGWLVSSYLGSQNAIHQTPQGTLLRYSVTKYVAD